MSDHEDIDWALRRFQFEGSAVKIDGLESAGRWLATPLPTGGGG
jgi:hypothetical protein